MLLAHRNMHFLTVYNVWQNAAGQKDEKISIGWRKGA
jgi:hypothetical protein